MAIKLPEPPTTHSVLHPSGRLVKGAHPALEPPQVLDALRWMMLSRLYDVRAIALQRQGMMGTYSPVTGQEASVVGSALALEPARDWVVPAYRELPALVRHGYPLDRITASYMGKLLDGRIPDGVNVLPNQVALAAQLQHAAGLAWGLRLQGKRSVVIAYFGEGASSEGDFHEACNLAGVMKAPIVFWLQNNQWAISTPRAVQSAARSLALRAQGYGFPGLAVDGNDLLACYDAARQAVDRARSGGGPTLVEAITYRMGFHNTTDNPREYQDDRLLEEARERDPIARVQRYLAGLGLWDEAADRAMLEMLEEEIGSAIEIAVAAPGPQPGQVFDNVYADSSPRLERQRQTLLDRG